MRVVSPSLWFSLHNDVCVCVCVWAASIAAKIIVSYVQFVSMANGLDIQWSSELRTLFTVQQFAGSGGDSVRQ